MLYEIVRTLLSQIPCATFARYFVLHDSFVFVSMDES